MWNLKTVKLTEAESIVVITRGREVGEMGRYWSKGTKFQLCRMNESRAVPNLFGTRDRFHGRPFFHGLGWGGGGGFRDDSSTLIYYGLWAVKSLC